MATISGGVTTNTTGVPAQTLQGVPTLAGLANVFPAGEMGNTYNMPVQQNTANQLMFNMSRPATDPFASQGLSQTPMLAQVSDMAPITARAMPTQPDPVQMMQPPADNGGIAPITAAPIQPFQPRADNNGLGPIVEAIAESQGARQEAPKDSAPAPVANDEISQLKRDLEQQQRNLERMQEVFYSSNSAPNNAAAPVQAPAAGPAQVAQPGTVQPKAPPIWQSPLNFLGKMADNYNFNMHPHVANYRQAMMQNERALEVARINAEAAMNRERYQQEQMNARTAADNTTKQTIAEKDNETKLATAKIGQALTKAQQLANLGKFYGAEAGSAERKQMAQIDPTLADHINDPQDAKAAAEYQNAAVNLQKNTVETTIALATQGAQQQKLFAEAAKAGIDAQKEFALIEADIQKRIAEAKKASTGAMVAEATAPADINQANQNAYAAYVNNQYLPTLKGQAVLGNQIDMGTKQIEAAANLPVAAPGADRKGVQAMQQRMAGSGAQMLMGGGGLVPPPPPGGMSMPAGFNPNAGMVPPPPPMMPMNLPPYMLQGGVMQGQQLPPQGMVPPPPPGGMMMPPQMQQPQQPPPQVQAQAPAQPPAPNLSQPRANPVDETARRAQLIATQLPPFLAKKLIEAAPKALASIPGQIYGAAKGLADAGDAAIGKAREEGFQREMKTSITEFMRPEARGFERGAQLTDPDLISQFAIKSHGNQRWYQQMVQAAGWGGVNPTRQPQPLTEMAQAKYDFEKFPIRLGNDTEAMRKYRAQQDLKKWQDDEAAARRKNDPAWFRPRPQQQVAGQGFSASQEGY